MGEICWTNRGILKDANMPKVDDKRLLAMGVRISKAIDLSPAIIEIGKIRSGRISYFGRPITSTETSIYTSLNEGQTWEKLLNGFIQNTEKLNDHPSIMLKYVIKSYLSTLQPDYTPKLYQVCIELSNLPIEAWQGQHGHKIGWNHVREEPLEWDTEKETKLNWGGIE